MASAPRSAPPRENTIEIRVRYQETDAQGRVHHANYFNFFEMGRIELLRAGGTSYRDLEEADVLMVVTKLSCKYHRPADFDDLLSLKTETTRVRSVSIEHRYELRRGDEMIAEAESTVACIDRSGKLQRIPDWLNPNSDS